MSAATSPSPPNLSTLSLEVDGEIGTLTLNRPDSLNAMSPELIFELTVAAAWLADQAPLRALIVTGAGERAFSSGGDVNWFKGGIDDPDVDLPADVRRGAEVLHHAIVDFRRIPYPVIGAVNGVAAGAGFSLALMCDLRIASSNAAFVCAYGRIGASPDGGMTYFLPRVVGPDRALALLLNDPLLSADEALEIGIVSKVVEPAELISAARQEGRGPGGESAALRSDGEATRRAEPRELAHRAPAGRAPRDRRLDGNRGPARGRHRLLRGPRTDLHRPLAAVDGERRRVHFSCSADRSRPAGMRARSAQRRAPPGLRGKDRRMKKLTLALALVALAALGLAACGGGSDSSSTTSASSSTTTSAAGGGGATLAVEADPNGQLAYTKDSLSTTAGDVTIEFNNLPRSRTTW